MSHLRSLLPLALLAAFALSPLAVLAQKPIERDMSPEEFKAAGLDKLSAEELANLNAWLNRTITTETTKAAEQAAVQAKEMVETENRGFFHFGSSEPIDAHIAGQFKGFRKGNTYTLDNGQQWRQTDTASLAGVRVENPAVKITPSLIGNTWYLRIEGYNTRAKVERVK